jgi:hypothetical protein
MLSTLLLVVEVAELVMGVMTVGMVAVVLVDLELMYPDTHYHPEHHFQYLPDLML